MRFIFSGTHLFFETSAKNVKEQYLLQQLGSIILLSLHCDGEKKCLFTCR